MSKLKFFVAVSLALLFVTTATTTSEARNNPRAIDHQTQYSHPWGGDENGSGGVVITATSVNSNDFNSYRYADGTKTGIVFGVFHFVWDNIEVFLTSYARHSTTNGKAVAGTSATSSSFTSSGSNTASGSNAASPAGSGGKGGQ